MCSDSNVGNNGVRCFYCELIVVSLTANRDSCNTISLQYVEDLEGKQVCIEDGVTNNFEDFLNMNGASFFFLEVKETRREIHREVYILKQYQDLNK